MSDATIIEIKQLLEDRKKAFDELRTTVEALDKAKADGKAMATCPPRLKRSPRRATSSMK